MQHRGLQEREEGKEGVQHRKAKGSLTRSHTDKTNPSRPPSLPPQASSPRPSSTSPSSVTLAPLTSTQQISSSRSWRSCRVNMRRAWRV